MERDTLKIMFVYNSWLVVKEPGYHKQQKVLALTDGGCADDDDWAAAMAAMEVDDDD